MSSNYRAICTSHTPALVIDHDYTYDEANNLTTRDSLGDHTDCDVVIGRYSYPLVEAACLGRQLPGPSGCKGYHAGPHWVDVAWLRLLTAATTAPNTVDPALLRTISTHGCWTPERMTSLRAELGMPEPPPTPTEAEAAHAVVGKAGGEELHTAIRTLARIDPEWWRNELNRMARLGGYADFLGAHR